MGREEVLYCKNPKCKPLEKLHKKRGKLHLSSSEYQLKRQKNNSSEHWSHETRISKENYTFYTVCSILHPLVAYVGKAAT
jgi:hypothetical protein